MSQAQLGELTVNSGRTIQAVELGKLALSEQLALRVSQATGVSVEWLLSGDPAVPPRADCPAAMGSIDSAYTIDVYETHRAHLEVEGQADGRRGRQYTLEQSADQHEYANASTERDAELVGFCDALLERTRGTGNAALIRWKIKKLLEKLDQENPASSLAHRKSRRGHQQRA